MEQKQDEISQQAIDDIISILDGYNQKEGNRMKIQVVDGEGLTTVHHHGRCDIGSPFACGLDFEVEDDMH